MYNGKSVQKQMRGIKNVFETNTGTLEIQFLSQIYRTQNFINIGMKYKMSENTQKGR